MSDEGQRGRLRHTNVYTSNGDTESVAFPFEPLEPLEWFRYQVTCVLTSLVIIYCVLHTVMNIYENSSLLRVHV